ncbi:MAG: carbamate kinase [Streptosporangiaceae bacterium]
MSRPRLVVALGGNALLERSERPDADIQEHHVLAAVEALSPTARDYDLVITHGNGPQVGMLATESEKDPALSRPFPFDVLGAQTQGMIGYWLLQALENALPGRRIVAILTRTIVAASDPAFGDPHKFVGPLFDEETARRLATERGWDVRADEGGLRRVVPSPEPRDVVELGGIEELLRGGSIVVCAGGGGIPVVRDPSGRLRGVEAVIDKDLTAALLAERLGAEALVILTDVAAVEVYHGTPEARPIGRTTVGELRSLSFPAGSMGPKVEAACRFVERTGHSAHIGQLTDVELMLAARAGTVIEPARNEAAI